MERAWLAVIVLLFIAACAAPQKPADQAFTPDEQQPPSGQQTQTTEQGQQTETRPQSKPTHNVTAFLDEMMNSLDCGRNADMVSFLEETKEKLARNEEKLQDVDAELKLVQGLGDVEDIAKKKKVVDIVKKSNVILKDRLKKLDELIARC